MNATDEPRQQIVCPACRSGLIHKIVVLHAGEDTLITCGGAWEALPSWLRDSFGAVKKGAADWETQRGGPGDPGPLGRMTDFLTTDFKHLKQPWGGQYSRR